MAHLLYHYIICTRIAFKNYNYNDKQFNIHVFDDSFYLGQHVFLNSSM